MSTSSPKSYGLSLDAFYGFPVFEEVTSPLVVCTNPGYHVSVIQVFGCKDCNRPKLVFNRRVKCVGEGRP